MNNPPTNFVFIMTDTQGANVLGCYQKDNDPQLAQDLQTVRLDRLAAEGIRFDRCYTSSPVCTPARAGLFTGMHAATSGPWANNIALSEKSVTMGQRFQALGYQTGYIGKWHLDGQDYFGDGTCPDGWNDDYWYDGCRYLETLTDEDKLRWRQGLGTIEDLREHNITREWTWGGQITEKAEHFLANRNDEEPFLLVVSYDEPHGPCTCPPEWAEHFTDFHFPLGPAGHDDLSDKPEHHRMWAGQALEKPGQTHKNRPLYFGCNAFIDDEIGRVLDAVEANAPENTWVIFTSDHGDMFGAHRLTSKGCAMYEEITRVPLIVLPPRDQRESGNAGRVVDNPISHLDLLPTMLELAGISTPPRLNGSGQCDVFENRAENVAGDVFVTFNRFAATHDMLGGLMPIRCIIRDQYKLVINLLTSDEFYDLSTDPHEMTNAIGSAEYAEVRESMHDALLDWMNETRDPMRGYTWQNRHWRKDRPVVWIGERRDWLDDGVHPPTREYGTGMYYPNDADR